MAFICIYDFMNVSLSDAFDGQIKVISVLLRFQGTPDMLLIIM
jgi:hypothetical protein